MADVLAIPGVPKQWMAHPKEYADASRDLISAYSSDFLGISDDFDKQLSSSPTDLFSFFHPYTSDSCLDFHLLHHPSPKTQTQQRPRTLARAMMNQHRFQGHPTTLIEDQGHYMPLRVEDPHAAAYSQDMSPFTVPLDLNSTLSRNGSTYCESDLESLEHFDEPFTTRTADRHAGLVHPTPRSNMFAANNSFLLGPEESSSLSSFRVSDVPQDEQAFSNTQFNVPHPNIANYPMNTHISPHPHNTYLTPSITTARTKLGAFSEDTQWGVCQPANMTDIWYPTRDPTGSSAESGWNNPNGYSAAWPVSNAYNLPDDCNEPETQVYRPTHGLPMPPFGPTPLGSGPTGPTSHISHLPASGTYIASIEVPQYQPTMHPMNVPSVHDTDFGSPDQKLASSLSPSFSASTNEEGRSPQQSGEGGVESGGHYSNERNTFLIDCKRRGLSYKDIKRVGGFKEAESTLRGRYRTLTKSKDQRVRKPKWQEKDIRLLCQAVMIHAESPDTYGSLTNASMNMSEPPKVSWKKVAEHIWVNGGSYHFGNATCKKKWCEIHHITL
ncbi:unnamed protein product [Penicillium egyptiacum]|uniref:Myb-like domain-containing protein n=1 Tax=Penicillium egyptiacum TaxID=1303716 RepID=A0A9W4P741_9EURO|nr:unnamed protein product [Penicillium egyptiacum]